MMTIQTNSDEIIAEFRAWLKTPEAAEQLGAIENEKKEVRELMASLSRMDRNSDEFTNLVLYGLLPYGKSKFAKRTSQFPAFLNIKLFLKSFSYSDEEWNLVANMIFKLAEKFESEPERLDQWISEFTSDETHSRMLQSGSLSPILFCINDSFPVINNKIIRTYKKMGRMFGWNDKMSYKLGSYLDSKEKCQKLIGHLGMDEVRNLGVFAQFCWWFEKRIDEPKNEEEGEDETHPISEKGVDLESFLNSIDMEKAKPDPHILRSPDKITIRELLQQVSKCKWQLPNFQRYFDWKKADIRDLLESIVRDFYIGSFLLWESDDENPLTPIPILGADNREGADPEKMILDGQQRITSLYYATTANPLPKTKNIPEPVYFYIDFKKYLQGEDDSIVMSERKLSVHDSVKLLHFPFYELARREQWFEVLDAFIQKCTSPVKLWPIRISLDKKLDHIISRFEIPYITLPQSVELWQVADIFEKINTKGKMLSVFDILIATLSKYDVDLRQVWDDAREEYQIFDEYNPKDKLPIYILQSIALSYHKLSLCGRKDLLKMYNTVIEPHGMQFDETWEEMSSWVNKAIGKLGNLRTGFGVKDRRSLPYMPVIPILASFLRQIDQRPDKDSCESKVGMWYWASVMTERYSSGVDGKLTLDYKEMMEWFDDETKVMSAVSESRRLLHTINLRSISKENNAIFRGIMSILALKGAPDFVSNSFLEDSLENDKHHIFPKAAFPGSDDVRSVLNRTWLSKNTNSTIQDRKPSVYLRQILEENYDNDEQKFRKMLSKHFINEKAFDCMLEDDLAKFVEERQKMLLEEVARRLEVKDEDLINVQIKPSTPFSNKVAIKSVIQDCQEHIFWIDKYFNTTGLEWLVQYLGHDVKQIRIITTQDKSEEKTDGLRKDFKKFREEMQRKGVSCELRVLDKKKGSNIHDRYMITKHTTYNIPSIDVIARGQTSDIVRGVKRPDFEGLWKDSLDIIDDWGRIRDVQ